MPRYEYKCWKDDCGHITEIVVDKMDGGPVTIPCEKCRFLAAKILSPVMHKNKTKGKP
jgi:predicted nucleic acid-binding Zn ribbon protein